MCFWDYVQGKITRDEVPICNITGEVLKVQWSGNNLIFLIPRNDRSKISIKDHNPVFQIEVKQLANPENDILKSSSSGNRVYKLALNPSKNDINFTISSFSKNVTYTLNDSIKNLQIRLIKPFSLDPDENNPIVYCFFDRKDPSKKGYGLVAGKFKGRSFTWTIIKEVDEDLSLNPITSSLVYSEKFIFAKQNSFLLDFFQRSNPEIRPFISSNNYIEMFSHYLFGWKGIEGIIARQGFILNEQKTESPILVQYNDNLIVSWSPNYTANKLFYAKQILAIKGEKVLGRIEIIGEKIRIYSDSIIINEKPGDIRYLGSKWILPDK